MNKTFWVVLIWCACQVTGKAQDSSAMVGRAATGDTIAITQLREAGPAGLQMLLERYRQDSKSVPLTVIDAVAKQKDACTSGLYWYTDFEAAKTAARAAGKPILSLRLLGNLDEEYSCANSRFFRTALYANAEVSRYLREHFILHWKSVRPVPKITIDYGDGRKLVRTITGNSIHYVLTADGQVVDALPGLYGPRAFLAALQRAAAADPRQLPRYHADSRQELLKAWAEDYRKATDGLAPFRVEPLQMAVNPAPTAKQAALVTIGKSAVERPLVNAVTPGPAMVTDDALWQKIAALHTEDGRLDAGSRALVAAKSGTAQRAGRLTMSKMLVEDPLLKVIRNFERSIAEDTVRNEYLLHAKLHKWLATAPTPPVDELNERVYVELFLTPRTDPWLGLAPADAYCALPDDGMVQAK